MDQRERINDKQEALLAMLDGRQTTIWTAMPGIVDSYNPAEGTCVIQITIQAWVRDQQGNFSWETMSLISDVPVVFPSGGGFTLTFPLQKGDEVLLVFSSKCADGWWQLSGVQPQAELRMHNLADGFAIPGPRSLPKVLDPPATTDTVQLRSDDGECYMEIASGHVVNIVAPGGLNITGDVNITGSLVASDEGTFNGGHTVSAHVHGGVQSGGSDTNTPTG